jgi:hypothetical protein
MSLWSTLVVNLQAALLPDSLLTMSIAGRDSNAAMLVRAGFVVVVTLINVSGFCPVLARGWHDQLGRSVLVRLGRPGDTYAVVTNLRQSVVYRECPLIIATSGP